jgi:hypothetical protein
MKVIKEQKRREADRLILSAKNKNKALWKIINKEIGNSHPVSNIIINTGAKKLQILKQLQRDSISILLR